MTLFRSAQWLKNGLIVFIVFARIVDGIRHAPSVRQPW
jgi:hypothetical protein